MVILFFKVMLYCLESFFCNKNTNVITVEPRFNDLRYNNIPGITINIRLPSKSYSKMCGAEPRYNDLRYNDIPGLTMGMSLTEHKIFPVITIKSISHSTTGNANFLYFW